MDTAIKNYEQSKNQIVAARNSANFAAFNRIIKPTVSRSNFEGLDLHIFTRMLRDDRQRRMDKRMKNPDASESDETPRTRLSRIKTEARRESSIQLQKDEIRVIAERHQMLQREQDLLKYRALLYKKKWTN